jgi:hypothetical protein
MEININHAKFQLFYLKLQHRQSACWRFLAIINNQTFKINLIIAKGDEIVDATNKEDVIYLMLKHNIL